MQEVEEKKGEKGSYSCVSTLPGERWLLGSNELICSHFAHSGGLLVSKLSPVSSSSEEGKEERGDSALETRSRFVQRFLKSQEETEAEKVPAA